MSSFIFLWIGYAAILIFVARISRGHDALLPGRIGVVVQALAYVATYVSAVALVGFGGLCYLFGLQMLLVAAGNVWFGTWFVYKYLAWPTRLWQRKLGARTPAELISKAYNCPFLQMFIGLLSAVLLVVYGSAVFKGAAVMLAGVIPVSVETALVVLVALVGLSVVFGGLRGVLYTEALQGLVMAIGVGALLVAVICEAGGPINGLAKLSALPPTNAADNGFLALSSGAGGLNVIFLAVVTSIGIWAQPQLIQRHFALHSKGEAGHAAPLAMLVLSVVVGGAYFASALSRVVLGGGITDPDTVMPALVHKLLPALGQQLFALAIVSASLSTASALLHIASGSIGRDVFGKELKGNSWRASVILCTVGSGIFAMKSGAIIAVICATSWTLLACAIMVPYIALLMRGPAAGARAAAASSICGLAASCAWYAFAYASTSVGMTGISAPGIIGAIHPIVPGIAVSALAFIVFSDSRQKISAASE
ncbi:MAG: sodium:solute symporter family protein [Synergistes sp.]|nr:sodium:solute symporter family protein [Synergistes sp.]